MLKKVIREKNKTQSENFIYPDVTWIVTFRHECLGTGRLALPFKCRDFYVPHFYVPGLLGARGENFFQKKILLVQITVSFSKKIFFQKHLYFQKKIVFN